MTSADEEDPATEALVTGGEVWRALTRSYRVTWPMLLLASYVPFYVVLAERASSEQVYTPELALDALFPVVPAWSFVYGSFYLFLIVLPVVVIQQEELIRRTVWSYLAVWTVAYTCFLLYPTFAPRPGEVTGSGFAAWGLRFLYDSDPPYNCFPSLHVAHSFVGALACHRVNRRLGVVAVTFASLVALSTLFIKQHWVADAVAGVFLAVLSTWFFLRSWKRANMPDLHRRLAPFLALPVAGIVCLATTVLWVVYKMGPYLELLGYGAGWAE